MAHYKKHHAIAARQLGLQAARRMALLSATVHHDQVDEACLRENEFLGMAVSLAADGFALRNGGTRGRFESAVGQALDEETDRILSLITRGPSSPQ